MKCFLKATLISTLALFAAISQARPLEGLVDKTYSFGEQSWADINWLYIGYIPRMEDPSRVRVVLSKKGFTMRTSMMLTPSEVAAYPDYLVRRFNKVDATIASEGLRIPQTARYSDYAATILSIKAALESVPNTPQDRYRFGFTLLQRFFPANVFEIVESGGVTRVEAHFVYPITIHKSVSWPREKTYTPYNFEERRSYYTKKKIHLFGGFPAFWLDPAGAGTGVHGPIRYSKAGENRRDDGSGKMRDFWSENSFPDQTADQIAPAYRWDLVRKPDSNGCFRAEPLELRHALPSSPSQILGKVEFEILAGYDVLSVPGHFDARIVNVDYYVVDPYQKGDPVSWQKANLLNKDERSEKNWAEILETKLTTDIVTFPYLNPGTLEFVTPRGGGSERIMSILNRAN